MQFKGQSCRTKKQIVLILIAEVFHHDGLPDFGTVLLAGDAQVNIGDGALKHFLRGVDNDLGNFLREHKFGKIDNAGEDQDNFSHGGIGKLLNR